jgi:hypothetical protein
VAPDAVSRERAAGFGGSDVKRRALHSRCAAYTAHTGTLRARYTGAPRTLGRAYMACTPVHGVHCVHWYTAYRAARSCRRRAGGPQAEYAGLVEAALAHDADALARHRPDAVAAVARSAAGTVGRLLRLLLDPARCEWAPPDGAGGGDGDGSGEAEAAAALELLRRVLTGFEAAQVARRPAAELLRQPHAANCICCRRML